MKIITNDAVYVQMNDIAYLNSLDLPIPASIYMKAFGMGGITIINDMNRYDFIKFEEKSEIQYFKDIDWMIDYNEVKDLSEDEIIKLAEKIGGELESVATAFNSMSEEERRQHIDMAEKCDSLGFKFCSLRDFLWFKQGHIPMKLPKCVNHSKGRFQKRLRKVGKTNKLDKS